MPSVDVLSPNIRCCTDYTRSDLSGFYPLVGQALRGKYLYPLPSPLLPLPGSVYKPIHPLLPQPLLPEPSITLVPTGYNVQHRYTLFPSQPQSATPFPTWLVTPFPVNRLHSSVNWRMIVIEGWLAPFVWFDGHCWGIMVDYSRQSSLVIPCRQTSRCYGFLGLWWTRSDPFKDSRVLNDFLSLRARPWNSPNWGNLICPWR